MQRLFTKIALLIPSYIISTTLLASYTLTLESPYIIIIDGGSTGSRLHIFEFVSNENTSDNKCLRRGTIKAWTPLSAFGRSPEDISRNVPLNSTYVAEHMLSAFDFAATVIPSEYHSTTMVKYQATAGMRLLDTAEQVLVYDALYKGLVESNNDPLNIEVNTHNLTTTGRRFVFDALSRSDLGTLGGEMEGFYGAVATNYLKGIIDVNLHIISDHETKGEDKPLGALDMGGSSTQIVFFPSNEDNETLHDKGSEGDGKYDACESNQEKRYDQTCPNPQYSRRLDYQQFFSSSYLSYGVDQFRERLWNSWIKDREELLRKADSDTCIDNLASNIIPNPCAFKEHAIQWRGYTLKGTGNAGKCSKEIKRLIPHHDQDAPIEEMSDFPNDESFNLVGGVQHPPVRGKFFAMSNYFFTLDCLRELSSHEQLNLTWPTPTLNELNDALDGLCSRFWHGDLEEIKEDAHKYSHADILPDRCFESVYLVTLLRDGFGFHPSSRDITFTYQIGGNEVEWALGMALSIYAKSNSPTVSGLKEEKQEIGH